jgi:hypothetical protein
MAYVYATPAEARRAALAVGIPESRVRVWPFGDGYRYSRAA